MPHGNSRQKNRQTRGPKQQNLVCKLCNAATSAVTLQQWQQRCSTAAASRLPGGRQALQGQRPPPGGDDGCRGLRQQLFGEKDGIKGLLLLRQALQRRPEAPQEEALLEVAIPGRLSHLFWVLHQARHLRGAVSHAGQRPRHGRARTQDSGRRPSFPDLRAQERGAGVSRDLLEVRVVAAHRRTRHDDLPDVDVEVVVAQAEGLEERGELGSQRRASLDRDALGRPRQLAALQRALDAEHLQGPAKLRNDDGQGVRPGAEAL
mmetsp:Transcript_69040/g.159994  ORF Transcript_69040/g.159994 Transcript_69040/m.159994 type:complete len:262 (-) Transcript_69040:638-1423(-)